MKTSFTVIFMADFTGEYDAAADRNAQAGQNRWEGRSSAVNGEAHGKRDAERELKPSGLAKRRD